MRRWPILTITHAVILAIGFASGIYTLPLLTAPQGPGAAALRKIATQTLFTGRFVRNLKGSDLLHRREGEVRLSRNQVSHTGRLAPGPDYKLYLTPRFVDTKEGFLQAKHESHRVGDVKTFNGFIVEVPADIDVFDYKSVVIWCEAFEKFITATAYQPSSEAAR